MAEHQFAFGIGIGGQRPVVYPHLRCRNALPDKADGRVRMPEPGVHHIGNGGVRFTHAVHHHTEQTASAFLFVAVHHLQSKKVVGRRAEICVEDDKRNARVLPRRVTLAAS